MAKLLHRITLCEIAIERAKVTRAFQESCFARFDPWKSVWQRVNFKHWQDFLSVKPRWRRG